jgi:putative component of membrane protein insertase Oxa1/YidC/SpoIIIJ protein YidD
MLSHPHPNRLRQTLADSIGLYQKYLSPHKGFSCAYRVYHRGLSCSQYCKEMILERGPIAAITPIRQRFRDCKQAAQEIRAQRHFSQGNRPRDHINYSDQPRRSEDPNKQQRTCHLDGCRSNRCDIDPCQPDCVLLGCELVTPDLCDLGGADCLSGADCFSCSI